MWCHFPGSWGQVQKGAWTLPSFFFLAIGTGRSPWTNKKLESEAQSYDTFILEVSNPTIEPEREELAYKGLLRMEAAFSSLKHGTYLCPVYHRLEKRICAHVTLCTIAYLLKHAVKI
jgi:hypothetical protein